MLVVCAHMAAPQPLADPNAVTVGRRVVVLGGGTNGVYALSTTTRR